MILNVIEQLNRYLNCVTKCGRTILLNPLPHLCGRLLWMTPCIFKVWDSYGNVLAMVSIKSSPKC